MIWRLTGELVRAEPQRAVVDVNGVSYEVLVPSRLGADLTQRAIGKSIMLYTYHFVEGAQGRGTVTPRLAGFESEEERDCFILLITVPGMGVRAALKALAAPAAEVADAIERGDEGMLAGLPGVGRRTAQKMIAQLQGKLTRFAGAAAEASRKGTPLSELEGDVVAVLMQLNYRRDEARRMFRDAIKAGAETASADEVLREVFRRQALPVVEEPTLRERQAASSKKP